MIVPLTIENFQNLPKILREDISWEVENDHKVPDKILTKEIWILEITSSWGSCGQIFYPDPDCLEPDFIITYGPSDFFRACTNMPSGAISTDAILISRPQFYAPKYIGEMFNPNLVLTLKSLIAEAAQRGIRALEAYALKDSTTINPLQFTFKNFFSYEDLSVCGFFIIQDDTFLPRLRLEITGGLAWKQAVEHALDKLVDTSIWTEERRILLV